MLKVTKRDTVIAASAFVLAGGIATAAFAAQPHMDRAISLLQEARSELEAASKNKGGHRVKAIDYINAAIKEVREGRKAADS